MYDEAMLSPCLARGEAACRTECPDRPSFLCNAIGPLALILGSWYDELIEERMRILRGE